ncbi:MAG: YdaS family helix-turn-helix protein [Rhodoferax sp.]|nr:YdaS family helix-turn-helix protein [Rhodoferax sp.]MDP3651065.1 YdaS family helix-turn-helix protein [Rhodoferax sp.]
MLTLFATKWFNAAMKFKSYFFGLAPVDRKAFADKVGTSVGHLNNFSYGTTKLAPAICVAIEKESRKAVTRQELRPDDWPHIWPELAQAPANTAQAATETVAVQAGENHDANHDSAAPGGVADCQAAGGSEHAAA